MNFLQILFSYICISKHHKYRTKIENHQKRISAEDLCSEFDWQFIDCPCKNDGPIYWYRCESQHSFSIWFVFLLVSGFFFLVYTFLNSSNQPEKRPQSSFYKKNTSISHLFKLFFLCGFCVQWTRIGHLTIQQLNVSFFCFGLYADPFFYTFGESQICLFNDFHFIPHLQDLKRLILFVESNKKRKFSSFGIQNHNANKFSINIGLFEDSSKNSLLSNLSKWM